MDTLQDSNKNWTPEIHFAPLQGYTDIAYYLAFSIYFPYVDFYYTPYYSIEDDLSVRLDTIPDRILSQIVPQILPKTVDELKLLLSFVQQNNFTEINLNLGCPYPMVTKRGRGAALIGRGEVVADMINFINDHSDIKVSIKTRLGLEDEFEIFKLLDTIDVGKIDRLIVHPRTARQLYKGRVNVPIYQKCREMYPQIDMIYNGDITNLDDFNCIQELLNGQQKWMIGRGLLSNPFLSGQIKGFDSGIERLKAEQLYQFIVILMDEIIKDSNDRGHALNRIRNQFDYLSNAFPVSQKIIRGIKKIKSISELEKFLYLEFLRND